MLPLFFFRLNRAAAFPKLRPYLWLTAGTAGLAGYSLAFGRRLHLDSNSNAPPAAVVVPNPDPETVTDPDTGISFPKTLRVGAKVQLPLLQLVGVGVRTVSFLGLKVYSIAFYADLSNPSLKVPHERSPEEQLKYIVQNSACLLRIVPTRTTSYTHLRDAFVRALHARLALGKKQDTLTETEAFEIASPIGKLKTLFPNAPLAKNKYLDIFLPPPVPGQPRALIFRDLGSVESDWVAHEFVLHYFEGQGPSPALKKSVIRRLENIEQ